MTTTARLIFSILASVFTSTLYSFINMVTVFKKANPVLKRHNYIITCGDIHEGTPELNTNQIKAIRSLIAQASPQRTLFLVEDVASASSTVPLMNDIIARVNNRYNDPSMNDRIPLVTLVGYAQAVSRKAINLDERIHTFLQSIFYYLIISHLQRTDYRWRPASFFYFNCRISLHEIGILLKTLITSIQEDYAALSKQLHSETNLNAQCTHSPLHQENIRHYLDFFRSFEEQIALDLAYADHLLTQQVDLVDYLITEYKTKNALADLNLVSAIDGFNFSLYAGSTFFARMLAFGSYTVELKALKLIVEHLNVTPRIYVFAGQKHIQQLNRALEHMSFKIIYRKTQTKNSDTIYRSISQHIQRAKSVRASDPQFIHHMKQQLRPIHYRFFEICKKAHLNPADFSRL